ncbi:MAG: phosphate/phosphite/phosphonate ABC transporter substrate-binding protein [Planctomycetia bacterium]
MIRSLVSVLLAALASLSFTACGDPGASPAATPGATPGGSSASSTPATPWVLRCTGIPDSKTSDLAKEYVLVKDYLAKALGADVQFEIVKDYDAAVTALTSGKADLAWLGGHTTVIAEESGKVELVACRDLDLRFKTYFIAHKDAFERLGGKQLGSLAELKGKVEGLKFTFGSQGSTSGHLMPRHFMNLQGVPPEATFGKDNVAYSGNHSNTLKQVSDGTVHVGALNYTDWEKASAEVKASAPLLYVTPDYVDYCWVANQSLGKERIARIRAALTSLDKANPEHAPILEAWGKAGRLLAADPAAWQGIRDVRAELLKSGILKRK